MANALRASTRKRISVFITAMTGLVLASFSGGAQDVQHLSSIQRGGMPGTPTMTGIQQTTNGFTVTWDGPSGYYHLYQKSSLQGTNWQPVGNFTLNLAATVTNVSPSNEFFSVTGPKPDYAGAQVCMECHAGVHSTYLLTDHAEAFASLQRIHQNTNPSCLPCHTVGYGVPTGFTDATNTPYLEGVQCENCHGPAKNHALNPNDPTLVPRVDVAAQVCGGCHAPQLTPAEVVTRHPYGFGYDDWSASPHGTVVPEALAVMKSSVNNITTCGRCHSGTARTALLLGENPSTAVSNDIDVALTCAVCHDPHSDHVWTNELAGVITFTNQLTGNVALITNTDLGPIYTNQNRYPFASLQDYHATGHFATNYDANINICAQCHNDRGASWTDTARAPHHSPQYNMLLGTVGELASGPNPGYPAAHSRLEMQCTECHMQLATNNPSGHTFEVATFQLCSQCHSDPAGLVAFVTDSISNQIQQTKALLDMWATNAAPAELRTNYGTLAWEYTSPGDLSTGGPGPDAAQQALISTNIMKARFDMYLVLYDGSYGVHNGPYDVRLLNSAQSFVDNELFQ